MWLLKRFRRLNQSISSYCKGFTLIELLIVIAIIAVLAAIIFPVFNQAREKAKQATCQSNLRQIAMAFVMYAQDWDETFPFAYHLGPGWNPEYAWDFTLSTTDWITYDIGPGLLGPYTMNNQIKNCPSFHGEAWGRPYTGYAYNTSYIGGTPDEGKSPTTLGSIQNPAETVLIADSGWYNVDTVAGNNYLRAPGDTYYPGIGPNVHFRHNGTANVAYVDGHVKSVGIKYNVVSGKPQCGDLSADDSAYDLN